MSPNLQKNNVMKQKNIGNWWGALTTLAGRLGAYVSLINLVLITFFAYPTVSGFIVNYTGISIPFWIFMLIIFLSPFVIMIFEYKFFFPSFMAFNNQQAYRHDNPIRRDLEILKKEVAEIKEILEKKMEKPLDKSS